MPRPPARGEPQAPIFPTTLLQLYSVATLLVAAHAILPPTRALFGMQTWAAPCAWANWRMATGMGTSGCVYCDTNCGGNMRWIK